MVKIRNSQCRLFLIHSNFCVSGALGLEIKVAAGTANVMCSNLTTCFFFQTGN